MSHDISKTFKVIMQFARFAETCYFLLSHDLIVLLSYFQFRINMYHLFRVVGPRTKSKSTSLNIIWKSFQLESAKYRYFHVRDVNHFASVWDHCFVIEHWLRFIHGARKIKVMKRWSFCIQSVSWLNKLPSYHWQIQGRQGYAPPRSNFFHFHAVFGKFSPNNRLAPPFWDWRPTPPNLGNPGSATIAYIGGFMGETEPPTHSIVPITFHIHSGLGRLA